jgi:hypothetical protein
VARAAPATRPRDAPLATREARSGGQAERGGDHLHTLFAEHNGYHTLLLANETQMPSAVAATAWQHALTCPTFNDRVFDAIRDFRATYTDKGPELVP